MRGRVREWWQSVAYGTERPGRRIASLALCGVVAGLGEAAVILLVVALVSSTGDAYPAIGDWVPDSTWGIALGALAAVAVTAVAHAGSSIMAARTGVEVQSRLQERLITAFLDAPWPVQAASPAGQLQEMATARVVALSVGAQEAALAMATALNLGVVLVAATMVSPLAMLALLTAVIVVVVISLPVRRRRRTLVDDTIMGSAALALDITDAAMSARDLRVFGVVSAARTALVGSVRRLAAQLKRLRAAQAATGPLTRDATVALIVLGLAVVVSSSSVDAATLGSTVVLMLRALAHAQGLTLFTARFEERRRNQARLEESLRHWHGTSTPGTSTCGDIHTISLHGVTYAHSAAQPPAIDHVDLDLRRGEMVGVVGRTGAGKTTLASLLLGLLVPDDGQVLVSGTRLRDIVPELWHAQTAWLGQEPRLIAGTVADNVRFFRDDLSDQQMLEAAQAAGLGRELEHWGGLDHPVGPGGSALSGGQRQRVALARALAGDPALLVLDEPTSALDAHAEAAVRDALDSLRGRAIVVVIAHRLSTVSRCDRLVLLEDGRIAAAGPPERLLAENAYLKEVLALSR